MAGNGMAQQPFGTKRKPNRHFLGLISCSVLCMLLPSVVQHTEQVVNGSRLDEKVAQKSNKKPEPTSYSAMLIGTVGSLLLLLFWWLGVVDTRYCRYCRCCRFVSKWALSINFPAGNFDFGRTERPLPRMTGHLFFSSWTFVPCVQ